MSKFGIFCKGQGVYIYLITNTDTNIRVKPLIFIPREIMSLENVLSERHENFDIYWYCWPMDGPFPGGDYEPVILIYSQDFKICYLVVRRAWQFIPYKIDELEQLTEVSFDYPFHHPFPKTTSDKSWYEIRKALLSQKNYDPKLVPPSDISEKFRIGTGHPTGARRLYEDPATFAQNLYDRECKDN